MDLYYYKIKFLLLVLFLISCNSIIEEESIMEESNFEIITFYTNYDNQENELSVYLEVSENIHISSISTSILNPDNLEIISNFDLENYDVNPNIFFYSGILELSNDISIYDINIDIHFSDQNNYSFSDQFTIPISPEIIEFTMNDTHQLDPDEWTFFPIDIQISDLNGLDNIEFVMYEVLRAFNGCNGDCLDGTNDCNEPITDDDYFGDDSWIFNYIESADDNNDYSYQYHVDIPMRPISGVALYDEDGNIISGESDCGRTGTVFFKFLVSDKDGLSEYIIDIPLEIID